MLLPDIACPFANPPCRDFGCFAPRGACSTPTTPCLFRCDCEGHCGKDTRVDLMGTSPDLRSHDVIVFEEAFSDSHRSELRNALRPFYAHQSTVLSRDHGTSQDGGVMVFSKWPIEEVVDFVYPKWGCGPDITDPECQADKGVQYVRINKGGQRHHIFGTHTNAFDPAFRLSQIFEMRDFIDRTLPSRIEPGDAVIMAGDFNINFHREPGDYNLMINVLRAVNPAAEPLITNPGGKWLDYVLYHRDYEQPSSASAYVIHPREARSPYRDGDLSDHYATLARFVFHSPGAPPPPPPPPPPPDDGGGPSCRVTRPTGRPILGEPFGCFAAPASPTFTWSPVAWATDYKLALFETTDPAQEALVFYEPVPGTSFALPFPLPSERRYRWKVKGQNCAGPGLYSDQKWFTLSADCRAPETAPVLIGPSGCVDAVRPTFTWERVPRATDYRIVVSPSSHDDFFIDQTTSETALVSPVAIDPQVPHRFKVQAINDAGFGPWADSMPFTTFCNGVAPTIREPRGCISTQQPVFTWDSIPAAVEYWLLVGDSPDFSSPATSRLIDVHLPGTSFATPADVVFTPRQRYFATVKAILDPMSTTAAAWSQTVAFTPLCVPNDSAVVSHSIPATMTAGRTYSASVTMRNTGGNLWTPVANYALGAWAGGPWGVSRVAVPAAIVSDQQAAFNFTVTAPAVAGTYISQWRMLQELDGPQWFGQVTAPIAVSVLAPLTVVRSGGGSGSVTASGIDCGLDCADDYAHGTVVTLTAAANFDSTFQGWTGCDSVTANTCTVTMTTARTVTAAFQLRTYPFTVTRLGAGAGTVTSTNATGIDCGTACSATYAHHQLIRLRMVPAAGSTFVGWSGSCQGTQSTCDVVVDGPETVTATFQPPALSPALQYYPLPVSCRVVDTRASSPLLHGQQRTLQVTGTCVPPTAVSVAAVVTAVAPTGGGSIRMHGGSLPLTSVASFPEAGGAWASSAVTTLNSQGQVVAMAALVGGGSTHFLIDVTGYFAAPGPSGQDFTPFATPTRLFDTTVAAGVEKLFKIGGTGFPTAPAAAVALSVAAVDPPAAGHLTAYPSAAGTGGASTLNYRTPSRLYNGTIVRLGSASTGNLGVLSTQSHRLLIDINGVFHAPASGSLQYHAITPCRVLDTRVAGGRLGTGERSFQVRGMCGAIPDSARAVTANFSVVGPDAHGHLIFRATGGPPPTASTGGHLLYAPGWTIGSGAVLPLSSAATPVDDLTVFTVAPTHLLVDITGYFSAAP